MIGQLSRDVIGHLSVNSWCYWLWTLEMSLVHFNPTIVTVYPTYEMTCGFKPFTVFCCVLHCRLKKRLIVMQSFLIVLHYQLTWDHLMLEIQMTDKGENSFLQLHNHHSKVWGRRKNKWWWTLFMIPAIFTHIKWDKSNVAWHFRGKTSDLPIQAIAAMFVYSIKRRQMN